MIKKYRKKPIVIEALQYDGFHTGMLNDFVGEAFNDPVGGEPYIATLEGNHTISKGDYIIKGIAGSFIHVSPIYWRLHMRL